MTMNIEAMAMAMQFHTLPPSKDEFMSAACKANPNATNAALETYYTQKYGR